MPLRADVLCTLFWCVPCVSGRRLFPRAMRDSEREGRAGVVFARTCCLGESETLDPHKLRLIRQLRIGEAIYGSEPATHARVEATRRNVDVLSLDRQGPASSLAGPVLDRAEQYRSDPRTAGAAMDPQAPQAGDVAASLEHVDVGRAVGDDCAADTRASVVCRDQTPIARVEPLGPSRRALALDRVVVLLPWDVDGRLVERDAAKPVVWS